MASLKPYVDAGKFQPFEGNTDLVAGLKAVASHGHTPGHAIFVAESKGEKIVFWGDLMHVAAVQFAEPATTIQFDTDSKAAAKQRKAAAKQRKAAYADAAKHGYIVAASHLSFPGMGRLRAEGTGYRFIPLNYVAR
jgi:glyoxylase-like metal-dependent hydrolase (beta-lactamase superfamily II)